MTVFLLVIGQGLKEFNYSLTNMIILYVFPSSAFSLIHINQDIIRPQRFMNLTKKDFILCAYCASIIFVVYSLSQLIGEEVIEVIIKDKSFRLSIWILFLVYTFSNYEKSKQFRTKRSTE